MSINIQWAPRPRYGYKNRRECTGGCRTSGISRLHDSAPEAQYCNKLKLLVKGGVFKEYRSQVTYPLRHQDGSRCGAHRVDFEVILPDGSKEVHEYKGFPTQEWKLKRALFTWCYPGIRYVTATSKDLL